MFDQWKDQNDSWFHLRRNMGYASIVLIVVIMAVSSFILLSSALYPTGVVVAAATALFVDILGLFAAVWKIVLNPNSIPQIGPPEETRKKLDSWVSGSHEELPAEDAPVQQEPDEGEGMR